MTKMTLPNLHWRIRLIARLPVSVIQFSDIRICLVFRVLDFGFLSLESTSGSRNSIQSFRSVTFQYASPMNRAQLLTGLACQE